MRPPLLRSALLVLAVAAPPAAAADLEPASVDAVGPTTATVSVRGAWSDPASHEVTVRYGQFSPWEQHGAAVTLSSGGTASFRLTGLTPATTYQYVFEDTWSSSDPRVLVTTAPGTPANLRPPSIVDAGGGESRCDAGLWDDPGASIVIVPPAFGLPLRCVAAATNAAGTSTAASDDVLTSGALAYAPPRGVLRPVVDVAERTLTCRAGFFTSGGGIVRTAFEWLRDGAVVTSGAVYTVTPEDAGHSLVCRVTLSNAAGSTALTSAPVAVEAPLTTAATTTSAPPSPGAAVQRVSSVAPPTAALGKLLAQADRLTARGHQPWSFVAPGPGRLRVTVLRAGRTLARGTAVASRAGLLRVRTTPTKAGRTALRNLHRRVVVEVAFTPAGATSPFVRRRSVRL